MKAKPVDPETFLTHEKIGWRTPSQDVEKRLGEVSGKHTYELCLFETYRLTEKFLAKHHEPDENEKLKHLYGLKAEILHYCVPSKIDWKKYTAGNETGQLIVKPNSTSDLYYRLIAYNLFLLAPWKCSRFLDFHFVHCVLIPSRNKTNSLPDLKKDFLQHLDYYVAHLIHSEMAFRRDEVFKELTDWNRKMFDSFSDSELIRYYDYKFDPNKRYGNRLMSSTQTLSQYAGCNDKLLKEYFGLLSTGVCDDQNTPFAPENSVQFLLWKWFGIGAPPEESELVVYLSLEQLIFFIREFLFNFQIDKISNRKPINQKQFVNLAYESLGSLFGDISASTVYKKFTEFAQNGHHPNLDWRNNESLRKATNN